MQKSGPEKRRLASAVRLLCARLAEADPAETLLQNAAEVLEGCVERLAQRPRRSRHVGYYERAGRGGGRGFDFGLDDLSPVSGAANPLAPPLRVEHLQKGHAVGSAAFPAFYGTRSGTVRNGYLAAAADEVFGAVLARMAHPIMTGILDMRFLGPCPAEKEVFIVGRVKRVSGQVIFTEAGVHTGEGPVAEAHAVFFVVGEGQYRQFAEERNRGLLVGERSRSVRGRREAVRSSSHRPRFEEALRDLCAEMVACDAPEDLFRETAGAVEALVERLQAETCTRSRASEGPYETGRTRGEYTPVRDLPVSCGPDGPVNPLAPVMNVRRLDGSSLSATLRFSSAFEGGPGLAHGGYVAAALDEVLVSTPSPAGGKAGPDSLKIRYRSPCPLNTELCLESRVHKRREGRTVVRATMHAGGRLVADGETAFPAE